MKFWIGAAVALLAAVAVAALVRYEYFFFAGYTVLMFIVLATAWNILGGYAGYVNFGAPAFFGLGAYTAAVLYKATAAPLALQIAAATVMAGLLGLLAGLLTLRLRGIFFAIATIALTVIMQT
ncbi:MAG TPA: branched-chain amino acid ABC transporter permease, partial [Burkholderiales bacterium]|nr:branched-chain amino acid ABC transporter permease [Burkholderiales bacterium]